MGVTSGLASQVQDKGPGDGFEDDTISEAELTELAMSADPTVPLAADAVPLDLHGDESAGFVPSWYMPPVMLRTSKRWHRWAIAAIIVAFITIDMFGLCSTYGPLRAA
ncbi:MAG: hypothetical protein ACRDQH_10690 [Pseudonocardiaceae bacterium]